MISDATVGLLPKFPHRVVPLNQLWPLVVRVAYPYLRQDGQGDCPPDHDICAAQVRPVQHETLACVVEVAASTDPSAPCPRIGVVRLIDRWAEHATILRSKQRIKSIPTAKRLTTITHRASSKLIETEYARDIFAELIVALSLDRTEIPPSVETREVAAKALNMASVFAVAQERQARLPPTSAHATAMPRKQPNAAASLSNVANTWMDRAVKRSAGGSRRDLKSRFNRLVFPHLGHRPFAEVQPNEILSVVRAIEARGHAAMAYNTFRDLCFLYRYGLASGLTSQDPTTTLRRAIAKPRGKGTRMITDPDSVGRLLYAIRRYKGKPKSSARYMLRLMPMVFLRASELRELEWPEVDLDAATIVVAASRMKMRRPHIVPLARQAVAILRDVHKMTGRGRYVFTSGRGVDKAMNYSIFHVMLGSLGYRRVVSAHGFRVLASTWLNEEGWPAEAIERQLSHLGSDRTRRLYNHAEYLRTRRRMMQAWADRLESLQRKAHMPMHMGPAFRRTTGWRRVAI